MKRLLKGFTLAEVLVVLGIIGVIALLSLPDLISTTKNKELITAATVMEAKLTEAMNQMRVNEKLTNYDSAEDFIQEFKKYMKVSKTCEADNIENCFGYSALTNGNETVNITILKNASATVISNSDEYSNDNIGFQLSNGTVGLLNYQKTCPWLDPYTMKNGRTDALKCLSMIYDINGSKKPNKVGKDIILLNAKTAKFSCVEHNNLCIGMTSYTVQPYNCSENYNSKYCQSSTSPKISDYKAGAAKLCDDLGAKLPTASELQDLAKIVYNTNSITLTGQSKNITFDANNSLGISLYGWYWSSTKDLENSAYLRSFSNNDSNTVSATVTTGSSPAGTAYRALCVK